MKKEIQGIRIEKIGQFQEALWYKIGENGDNMMVRVVYRTPSTTRKEENLLETLQQIEKYKRVTVVGDFIFPDIKGDSLEAETRESNIFLQRVQDNTVGGNTLNLLLTSEEEMVECTEIEEQVDISNRNCIAWNCIVTEGCKFDTDHVKKCVPLKKLEQGNNKPKWMTKTIKKLICKKRKA